MIDKQNSSYFPTDYWHKLEDGRVMCDLCPKHCALREGKRGACYIRMCHQQKIVLTSYGSTSGIAVDPIEKKPLFHFLPGSQVLSFGSVGCNLSCQFCQNWRISKARRDELLTVRATPQQLVETALEHNCRSIAFTYNDPVIFMEYAVDIAIAAKQQGVKSVAVSAGYICEEPRELFFAQMDAANIDLKGFTEKFYRKLCHGHLQPVLETLCYIKQETNVWLEVTNLLIPGENDSEQELHQMCLWIADNLGPDVPLHFSAFHPDFKMLDKQCTLLTTLLNARHIANSYGLNYVYCGNVNDTASNCTYCTHCQAVLIERNHFEVLSINLDKQGNCRRCGYPCPIIL